MLRNSDLKTAEEYTLAQEIKADVLRRETRLTPPRFQR